MTIHVILSARDIRSRDLRCTSDLYANEHSYYTMEGGANETTTQCTRLISYLIFLEINRENQ